MESSKGPKYPNISVTLVGSDGNAFAILGKVSRAMKDAKVPQEEISEYVAKATEGDYNNLLRVTMETVEVR